MASVNTNFVKGVILFGLIAIIYAAGVEIDEDVQ